MRYIRQNKALLDLKCRIECVTRISNHVHFTQLKLPIPIEAESDMYYGTRAGWFRKDDVEVLTVSITDKELAHEF